MVSILMKKLLCIRKEGERVEYCFGRQGMEGEGKVWKSIEGVTPFIANLVPCSAAFYFPFSINH